MLAVLLVVTGVVSLTVFSVVVTKDYSEWKKVCRYSILPLTPSGYIKSLYLTLVCRRHRRDSTRIRSTEDPGYIDSAKVSKRYDRVEVARWLIPHRQIFPPPALFSEMLFDSVIETLIAQDHHNKIIIAESWIEPSVRALFYESRSRQNEVFHIHVLDKSLHIQLTAKDARLLVDKGWAEIHPIFKSWQPSRLETMMIFAPRNSKDMEIFLTICQAGIEAVRSNLI